jgi:hypothetical protein
MKPIDQEFMHDPEKGIIGDCFRACIASILELDINEVPHFYRDHKEMMMPGMQLRIG